MSLKPWYVVTPEYGDVVPVCDDGTGPIEYGCDVIEIAAETKRDAISLGVAEMLKGGRMCEWASYRYCLDQRLDGLSPYGGVRAELAVCEHGVNHWSVEDGSRVKCADCDEISRAFQEANS